MDYVKQSYCEKQNILQSYAKPNLNLTQDK